MLGCGLSPNTSMHAIEELVTPPYLFAAPLDYTLVLPDGRELVKTYTPHNFHGWRQRYDRVEHILVPPGLRQRAGPGRQSVADRGHRPVESGPGGLAPGSAGLCRAYLRNSYH